MCRLTCYHHTNQIFINQFYQHFFFFFQNRNFSGYIVCFELPTHSLRKLSTSKKNVDVFFPPSTISSTQTKKNAQFFFCPGLERSSEIGLVSTQSHHRIINFFFFYEIVTLNTNINLDNSSTISLYLTVV